MYKEEKCGGWGARRIRSEKLREHQFREGYAWSLEEKRVECVEHMWEQVKWAMVESARVEVGSVRKNPKSVWWCDEVKTMIKRKEAAWKVLAASDEEAKQ